MGVSGVRNVSDAMSRQKCLVRAAVASEQKQLEALQWRASLNNAGDRDALLAHPDAIELPLEQIEGGGVLFSILKKMFKLIDRYVNFEMRMAALY